MDLEPITVALKSWVYPFLFNSLISLQYTGSEWSFSTQGINPSEPRSIPDLNLRDSISMGRSKLTVSQIEDIIYGMKKDYSGDSYHVLSKYLSTLIMMEIGIAIAFQMICVRELVLAPFQVFASLHFYT